MTLNVNWRLVVAAAGVVAIILYGSLYPFHFYSRAVPEGLLRALLETSNIPADRADNLSNFVLYLPLGFVIVRAMPGAPRWLMFGIGTLAGITLSATIEITQLFDLGRVTEMADVFSNSAGALAGAAMASILPRELQPGDRRKVLSLDIVWRPFTAVMLVCWIANRLFPYFPGIGFHLRAGAPANAAGWVAFFEQTIFWIVAGVLTESLIGREKSRAVLIGMAALVVFARGFLINGPVSLAETAGAIAGAILWLGVSRMERRAAVVTVMFVGVVIAATLAPYHFVETSRHFGWIPFESFMDGPRENGVRVFFEKTFTYGLLIWLPMRAGVGFGVAMIAAVALEFVLRQMQVYLPGRSAEITDTLMVVMLAAILKLVREPECRG